MANYEGNKVAATVIPKMVAEMAKLIEDAKDDPQTVGIVFIRKRQFGLRAAFELANSKDAVFEIVEQKRIEYK